MTERLKPGDLVRPKWEDKWMSSFSPPPTPITLERDRPRTDIKPEDIKLEDLFENHHVCTLKWTEIGQVIATDGDWLMLLFGMKYGWAPAKHFETLPE